MGAHDLPADRLATTDAEGRRVYLYPADVRGRFRRGRAVTRGVLCLIFLALPWLRIHGRQAVFLDVAGGRFNLFGMSFWDHDAPILFFVLAGGALTLGFVTAVWGRAWCGWACPQTVFTEGVFRWIERRIEGDALARRKLDEAPWTADKAFRKGFKWLAFTGAALVITHSFLAYFTGTERLLAMMLSSPARNPGTFLFMGGAALAVLFDFGWFREQFCTIVCPYGRFQSVLMDDSSLTIAYDSRRGEPRRGTLVPEKPAGDCVNCYRCVQVCPTGIDIRRGQQLECVACTACIDACDEVMTRTGKPPGLIRYESGAWLRPRTAIYLALIIALGTALGLALRARQGLSVTLSRAPGAPFEEGTATSGARPVVNHFRLELENPGTEPLLVRLELAPAFRDAGVRLVTPSPELPVDGGRTARVELFVEFPRSFLKEGRGGIRFDAVTGISGTGELRRVGQEVRLVGPLR